jgi:hypothetical protein
MSHITLDQLRRYTATYAKESGLNLTVIGSYGGYHIEIEEEGYGCQSLTERGTKSEIYYCVRAMSRSMYFIKRNRDNKGL